ncbi:hypothetical protein QAD02_023055 [Eretmocerus hayati]|uniref:Uncharacterized protein n=1 Tax=Eretmocerus hayati TaxID=131215 RepID=A0ACC2PUR4_9HYME|nr:hypothetical protein QAD02_023055 [Eretmocerus hayati]
MGPVIPANPGLTADLRDDSEDDEGKAESTANEERKMTASTAKTRVLPMVVMSELSEKEVVEFIQGIKSITQGKEYRIAYSNNVYKISCDDLDIYNILSREVKQLQEMRKEKGSTNSSIEAGTHFHLRAAKHQS